MYWMDEQQGESTNVSLYSIPYINQLTYHVGPQFIVVIGKEKFLKKSAAKPGIRQRGQQ